MEQAVAATANRSANLRGGPGTNYPVVGSAHANQKLQLIAQNAGGGWYQLSGSEWIAAFLVDNAPTNLPIAEAPPLPTPAPAQASGGGTGSGEAALEELNRAIDQDPANAEAYYARGHTYFDRGDLERAIQDWSKTIELSPYTAPPYISRGFAYFQRGAVEQALQDFNKAIELDPTIPVAYGNRAMAYLEAGKFAQAATDMETYLEMVPNDPQRAQIETAIEQIPRTIVLIMKAQASEPHNNLVQQTQSPIFVFRDGGTDEA